jgi:hypothetical protein
MGVVVVIMVVVVAHMAEENINKRASSPLKAIKEKITCKSDHLYIKRKSFGHM